MFDGPQTFPMTLVSQRCYAVGQNTVVLIEIIEFIIRVCLGRRHAGKKVMASSENQPNELTILYKQQRFNRIQCQWEDIGKDMLFVNNQ